MMQITGKTYYKAPPLYQLRDLLLRGRDKFKDRVAVAFRENAQDKEQVQKTYQDLYEDVLNLQQSLLQRLPRGATIALVGANSYEWMVTYLAVAGGFGTIVPLDRLLHTETIMDMLKKSEAVALFYGAEFYEEYKDRPEVRNLSLQVIMNTYRLKPEQKNEISKFRESEPKALFSALLQEGAGRAAALEASGETDKDLQPEANYNQAVPTGRPSLLKLDDPGETSIVLFTSGTSSEAKGVMLSNKSLTADIRALLGSVNFTEETRVLSILPLHHTFENTCGFLTILAIGGRIDICDGLRYISKNLKEFQTNLLVCVPTVLELIYRKIMQQVKKQGKLFSLRFGLCLSTVLKACGIDVRRKMFDSILQELGGNLAYVICGAAPLELSILKFFHKIGIEILQGYGLTEASPVVSGGNTMVNVLGTVGQPLSGITVAIDSKSRGENGEILVKSDSVMNGYFQNPEATSEVLDKDGFLHTGDIGHFSRRDTVVITGRSKSMIVLQSGKKVFPEELEELLKSREYIKDSLVFGQGADNGDIVVTAKLVVDEEKMRLYLQEHGQDTLSGNFGAAVQNEVNRLVDEVNHALPAFKGIRAYFYSFQDMIKTTTLKVRRGVELEKFQEFLASTKANWQDFHGDNIDELAEKMVAKPDDISKNLEYSAPARTTALGDSGKSETADKENAKTIKNKIKAKRKQAKRQAKQIAKLQREDRVLSRQLEDLAAEKQALAETERAMCQRQIQVQKEIQKLKES